MKTRVLFCLPTYNNLNTVAEVALGLLGQSDNDLLVVDDGSHSSVEELFRETLLEQNLPLEIRDRIFHLRSEENMGKGTALRKAFAWAIPRGYTHIVTVDADGHHPSSEALKIMQATETHPWALIIGHRSVATQHIPKLSKFGRKISKFWASYQNNEKVFDSQSGLRAYPLIQVQNLRFFTRRYDFEIEVLIRLIWKKVPVVEIPVDVLYHPPKAQVSHFRKLWDNGRLSALKALLVIVSLLREPGPPARLASALGLGVWIGCLPLYGVHTLLAAAFSFLFKLNFVALVVGTQISMPPLLPLLLPAAFKIGKLYTMVGHHKRFILGSITLGFILGLLTFLTTWISLLVSNSPKKARKWHGEPRRGRLGNWIFKMILKYFGLRMAYFCVRIFVVPYFYFLFPSARRSAAQYWKIIRPQQNFFQRQAAILSQMYRFETVLLDSVYFSLCGRDEFSLESHGYTELQAALDRKNGVLMISAHIGAWELAAHLLNCREMIEHLQVVRLEGEVVSLMGDHPLGANIELLTFFGKLVVVDLAPFRTALAGETSTFFAFGFREAYKRYSFHVGEIIIPTSLSKEEQLHFLAQSYLIHLEIFVKKYPTQWFNWSAFFSHASR